MNERKPPGYRPDEVISTHPTEWWPEGEGAAAALGFAMLWAAIIVGFALGAVFVLVLS